MAYVYRAIKKTDIGMASGDICVEKFELTGGWVPSDILAKDPAFGFYDFSLKKEDCIYLAEFLSFRNPISYLVHKICDKTKTHTKSQKIVGLCRGLFEENGNVMATTWRKGDDGEYRDFIDTLLFR
ncbi:MAG: hypothetical protein KDD25_09895 [Bdellovibrionales bacterium]|nr:hypothetical protein [Bdellovibrionales bacterium]